MYGHEAERSRGPGPAEDRPERRMDASGHEYARRIDCADRERRSESRGSRGFGAPGAGERGGARRPD
jgi:hypothetical protein